MTNKQMAAFVAEFVGTFVLTSVAFVVGGSFGVLGALLIGLTLAVLVSMFANVSGTHVNPAVTAGMLALRKIKLPDALGYVVAQGLGAVVAWQLFEYFSGSEISAVSTEYDSKLLIAEAVGMAVFAMAVTAAAKNKLSGWAASATIGLGFAVGLMVASLNSATPGELTGTINPALSLGLRTFSAETLLGPIIGSVVGMSMYVWLVDTHAKKG